MNACTNTEKEIIAAVLKNPALFDVAQSKGITANSFTVNICKAAWNAACHITAEGGIPDLVSIGQRVGADKINELAELCNSIATTVNLEQWTATAKTFEAARFIEAALPKIEAMVSDREPKLQSILSALIEAESTAMQIATANRTQTLAEINTEVKRRLKSGADEIPLFPPCTEGRLRVHIHKGEFTTIGGRSGTGKTAFICGCVNTMLDEGERVLYVCTESDGADISARIISARTGIRHYAGMNRCADARQIDAFSQCADEITSKYANHLFIVGIESGIITPALIESKIREIENSAGKIDVVIVDFIQGVRAGKTMSRLSKLEQSEYCITGIHAALVRHHIAGIILSQLNRSGINTEEKPRMEFLKDCGLLDNLSHTVAFLYKDETGQYVFYSDKTRNQARFGIGLEWTGTAYRSMQIAPNAR